MPNKTLSRPRFGSINAGRCRLVGRGNKRQPLSDKAPFKRFSENAGLVGLVLGLVLSASSLYDVFVRKPDADRISAISQFNQTVNSAAKIRQDLIQTNQSGDAAARLAVSSMATPRILNDIATAKALLPELRDEDVGIPQLLILVTESLTAGDSVSAEAFIARAMAKKDLTPYMAAEARRYNGKYLFMIGKPEEARKMYLQANQLLGDQVSTKAPKAYNFVDLIGMQYALGYCQSLESDIEEFKRLVESQGVSGDVRLQLTSAVISQLNQYSGQKCDKPKNLSLLMALN